MKLRNTAVLLSLLIPAAPTHAKKAKDLNRYGEGKYKPIKAPPSGYQHDRWGTKGGGPDHTFEFLDFTANFDDDSDGDGDTEDDDNRGVPEWVAFEARKQTAVISFGSTSWKSVDDRKADAVAPDDSLYLPTTPVRKKFLVSLRYNLSRRHIRPRNNAKRLSADAAENTFTALSDSPQRQWHNNGIWKDLERLIENWADDYLKLWVTCGPVFLNNKAKLWVGEKDERPVAVPDGFFKIIVRDRDDPTKPHVLAFRYPHTIEPSDNRKAKTAPKVFPHHKFLGSVDAIEKYTMLDSFNVLTEAQQKAIEENRATEV